MTLSGWWLWLAKEAGTEMDRALFGTLPVDLIS